MYACTRLFKRIMHTSFQENYVHVFSTRLCTRLFKRIMYDETCDLKHVISRVLKRGVHVGLQRLVSPTSSNHISTYTLNITPHMEKSRHTYEKVMPHISKSHSPGCIFSYLLSLLSLLYKLTVELTFETCRPLRMRETSVRGHATTGTSCSSQTKIASRSPWPLPWVLLAACCWDSYVSTAVR